MPAKKPSVTTPLHLLQQLSNSLVEHLQKACSEAQKDAEMLLAKLEKQRGRTQEKIIKARAKLDEAGAAGKSKSQTKARSRLAELDDMHAVLQTRQSETLSYLSELKRDAEQSMQLAQGVTQVEQAAAQALAARAKANTSRSVAAKKSPARSAAKPASQPTETAGAAGTSAGSAAGRTRATAGKSDERTGPHASNATNAGAVTTSPGNDAVAHAVPTTSATVKKITARKPAASKRPTTTQLPPSSN